MVVTPTAAGSVVEAGCDKTFKTATAVSVIKGSVGRMPPVTGVDVVVVETTMPWRSCRMRGVHMGGGGGGDNDDDDDVWLVVLAAAAARFNKVSKGSGE